MRISDWSSDVCSSDLIDHQGFANAASAGPVAADDHHPLDVVVKSETHGAVPPVAAVHAASHGSTLHCVRALCPKTFRSGVSSDPAAPPGPRPGPFTGPPNPPPRPL